MSDEDSEHKDSLYFKKGSELWKNKKYEEALEIFEKILIEDPKNKLALLIKVNTLLHLNRYKEILEVCDKLIGICEECSEASKEITFRINSEAWNYKGSALYKLHRYEDVLEISEKSIEVFEKYSGKFSGEILSVYSGTWLNKGHALSELKRYDESFDAFDKAIEIRPDNNEAWIGKFFAAWENHKEEKALQIIENALSSTDIKDKLDWWKLKTLALTIRGNYGKALEACNNGLKINLEDVELLLDKGDIFFKLEAYNYALKSYEKAITIEPKNPTAWKYKSMSLLYLDRDTEFLEAFEQALNLDPNNAEINNVLAEYYLYYGDLKNASKYVENAFLLNKENAKSLYIMGKIKIEEQNYITSINCFKKAISLELRNITYLSWDSYAKYLMAELELASDEKKYQDTILGIIRELRKIDNCNYIESNVSQIISNWVFRIIPYQFKKIIIDVFEITKRALIDLNISEENTVKILEIMHPLFAKFENTTNVAYNYYFLGCFYYKTNDYFTAIDCLKQCKKLSSDREINNSASEILNNIWNNKIRPSFWKWWLYSPSNLWFKRISFIILSFFLFGILLPIQSVDIFKNSFFSSINWAENTVQLTLLTLTIIFILTSPNIQYFKSSQIEIEIRPPTEFELTPSLIERKLNELKYEKSSQK